MLAVAESDVLLPEVRVLADSSYNLDLHAQVNSRVFLIDLSVQLETVADFSREADSRPKKRLQRVDSPWCV